MFRGALRTMSLVTMVGVPGLAMAGSFDSAAAFELALYVIALVLLSIVLWRLFRQGFKRTCKHWSTWLLFPLSLVFFAAPTHLGGGNCGCFMTPTGATITRLPAPVT